ncbi:MAG: hypothetical protein ABIG20_04770 [archaeon]
MTTRKSRKIVIQLAILLAFIFGAMVAVVAYYTGSTMMGLIFLTAIQIIILLAVLFMMETITELLEAKL